MQPSQRRDEIVSLVHRAGEMSVDDLAEKLAVSRETIRRDLSRLDATGQLRKFHGGARTAQSSLADVAVEGSFAARMAQNQAAKRKIAHTAAGLFLPGDALFIDTGSTTVALAEVLVELQPLTVITNSLKIAAIIGANPCHRVFIIGGAYGRDNGESLGPLALEQIGKFHARHAVLTVGAIHEHGAMDFDLQETEVAKAMIQRSDEITVLADHSKFEKRGIFDVAPMDKIARIVTDVFPSDGMASTLSSAGTQLMVSPPSVAGTEPQ